MERRPKRLLSAVDNDDEAPISFPSELLNSIDDPEWHSPTKAQRTMVAPVKPRRRGALSQSRSKVQTNDNGGDDLTGSTAEWHQLPTRPRHDEVSEAMLELFVDAIHSYTAGFYHLHERLFVVQGWDVRRNQALDSWYHLEYLFISDAIHTVCTCPHGMEDEVLCIHRRFIESYDAGSLVQKGNESDTEIASAILFRQRAIPNSQATHSLFSVKSVSSASLKGRAIVSHKGSSPGSGIWRCSKDPGSQTCAHVNMALAQLTELYGELGEAVDGEHGVEVTDARQIEDLAHSNLVSISHEPILPPAWAVLPTDKSLYERPSPYRLPPSTPIKLDSKSSCPCAGTRTFYNPEHDTITRTCRVYTLTTVYVHQIQLQRCPQCPPSRRRFIGPDPRHEGLFNYNNSVLVSHELLDEYTSAYTSSETPFTAWVVQMQRRYDLSNTVFMGEDLFRTVWFAYVSLQGWENDMACKRCGPSPETVIWDGITVAFGRKHVTSSLRPPTVTSESSLVRKNVKYFPKQQLIGDPHLRKLIRVVLKGPGLGDENDDENDLAQPPTTSPSSVSQQEAHRRATLAREYLDRVSTVVDGLRGSCPALADLFRLQFGAVALESGRLGSSVYKNFFKQIAAEESVLQLVNYPSLLALREFLTHPETTDLTSLLSVPAVYTLLNHHTTMEEIIPIIQWIERVARETLRNLIVEAPLPSISPEVSTNPGTEKVEEDLDWKKTGCLYGMPKIRNRPKYPGLRGDQQKDKPDKRRGDRCGKYYSQYGQRRLTGGIMVAWCTHSICYGFHCIAESEGRDDVFSALVTRWPIAPKRVVYDFACALGPYCMLREPLFFANTLFAIDHFHSTGHSKCSPACFLSEYANVDPRLVPINSSAGECGNGVLKRIRKSVSYMSQTRAIIYTKVFLSAWNRQRARLAM
ncbi:hypothetical protein CC1G_00607 [Coprinopsis cinerea okayama7|uniref:HMG domain-containing protein n=1 Tax=Coprinopsis cinerea (strain Okayama-7 / 130 / ATCC MYA-4618 / FGSC 9003) TaxID=240176 RepID=A8N3I8_COPC7|nr:hypothetical protein CC1G_00607 [Coprinopsis cinerea okayama7\|eukprot:XP_001829428.2 hypothetical protein CC1G_00607 [Coprinopsis cinerea okayama7\